VLLDLTCLEQPYDGRADSTGERVPPERRAVLADTENTEDVVVRDDGGHRHDAPAKCLAEDVHVGDDALRVAREGVSGPAESALDLVGHEEQPVAVADRADLGEVAGRR